jgi:four helix bundle protein
MINFKKIKVWQLGFDIAKESYGLVSAFPKEEKYALVNQITRAAVSIPANIAEGSSRKSAREYAHFLEIALGSSYELETHILLAEALCYGDINVSKSILYKLSEEQKMLLSFINKIKTDG